MELDSSTTTDSSRELNFISDFAVEILRAAGVDVKDSQKMPKAEQLILLLKLRMLPFLRCSAILFHFLTNVIPPAQLKEAGASLLTPEDEFNILCQYLGLPSQFHLIIER